MRGIDYGAIGVWLLVIGVMAVAVECVLAAVWTARISGRARALSERLLQEQGRLNADMERLRQSIAEMQALWQPYGRLLRWLRHPITIALLQSYARRRAAAR